MQTSRKNHTDAKIDSLVRDLGTFVFFCTIIDHILLLEGYVKKNQNAPRPSEHPPVRCCMSHSAHWLPTRKKLLYTVANPARGLLTKKRERKSLNILVQRTAEEHERNRGTRLNAMKRFCIFSY